MKKHQKIRLTFFLLLFMNAFSFNDVESGICTPHDPNGENPETLCIKHYHLNFGSPPASVGRQSFGLYCSRKNI